MLIQVNRGETIQFSSKTEIRGKNQVRRETMETVGRRDT